MEEVRQLVQEEGREARNLVAFHVAVDTPARIARKPPRSVAPPARRAAPRSAARLRSASAGRDKRSELRARYWALLFGDLQRAIGEIYNTVEAHENLNECQEVILVLENYTRDFKALGEWFRLKWEYDNTPPPQRPQSLAWEIRKTDFVRPESRRAYSVKSSPSVSGKNSPCLSGHNTPSGKNSPVTGKASPGSGKISPRTSGPITSPKANLEFFSNKIASKVTAKPEPKVKEARLSDIKEKDVKEVSENSRVSVKVEKFEDTEKIEVKLAPIVELGKAREFPNICPKQVVIVSPKHVKCSNKKVTNDELSSQAKATIFKLDAMENEFLAKQIVNNNIKNDNLLNNDKELEMIETEKKINSEKVDDKTNEQTDHSSESPVKSDDNFADVSNESSLSNDEKSKNSGQCPSIVEEKDVILQQKSQDTEAEGKTIDLKKMPGDCKITQNIVADDSKDIVKDDTSKEYDSREVPQRDTPEKVNLQKEEQKKTEVKDYKPLRPAYSQAAAKPKPVTAKPEVKTPVKTITPVVRSKTVVEITNASKTRPFTKRNQTSKCSYPFNLTTGRTSLFDTPGNVIKTPVKKPVRSMMGSGDAKTNQIKVEAKKRPPRPTTLKVNEKGDKSEKTNLTLEKIKDCDEYSSSDTIVTQIDMSRIESSESLKTLVPEDLLMIPDVANSIEVLNVDATKNDNEGWLTVKSRRLSRESKKQSKSHWANRFNQPSATTSLPTLNMIESPKQEVNPFINYCKTQKTDRAKSEQPEKVAKPVKVVKVTAKPKTEAKFKNPAMIRQKSDVTGLKTRSSRNKVTKKEKLKDQARNEGELTKNRLHSSLESLTTGLARSQESTEEVFDFDKWKSEFKTNFKYLEDDDQIPNHNEILKAADPSEMSEIAEMTSQIEENERKISLALDFQSEVDQRKLCEEEDLLNRQIMELQQVSDIDLDTETDDTETDAEILCEDNTLSVPSCSSPETLGSLAASLEDQYETALAGMSWAERVDTLVVLEALVARDPGRAQQLHAKLSQGIKRRGSFQDALRRLQAKQARAERQRLKLQTERAKKIHQLLARVEEVKVAKNQLIEEKRLRMERRLQKATENRDQHLKDIVRKAHDEEEKLREIAFIKQLEAENRRHEFLDQCRSHTTRLRHMRRDRLCKLEQKAAREAAVGARRQALEAARKLHVETLLEKRKERDARVEELKELKKQERDDAAREKAEGVKSRLSALAAAAELEADALRSRIRDKQDASQQRLESHLQAIREKATGPRQATTSESQDQTAKEEKELQEEAERIEQERREKEKQKTVKKKARKVKQKLLATNNETTIFNDTIQIEPMNNGSKLYKVIHQLNNLIMPFLSIQNSDNNKRNEINNDEETDKNNKTRNKFNNIVLNGNIDKIDGNGKMNKRNRNSEERSIDLPEVKPTDAIMDSKEHNNNKETQIIIQPQETERNESNKKKNKRNRNKEQNENRVNVNDRLKLSKTNSVCSSLSDLSKASCKSDKKIKTVIDSNLLERHLNELHRMVDKISPSDKDKMTSQKIHSLKTLGALLAVAAEKDEMATQFSARSLLTAVTIIKEVISACTASACYVIASNTCVYVVKLLAELLDKDLPVDSKETELAERLCQCLWHAFQSVLVSTQIFYADTSSTKEQLAILTALRSRVHTLISYVCLTGCIVKADRSGDVRDCIQTVLTSAAELCQPCDADVGPERASAVQSLRCTLGTSVCGFRSEFCLLFARDADTGCSEGLVKAARVARLLKAIAELDHHIVQEAFGEGGWPLEFRAAVSRLLSQHAPNDRDSHKLNKPGDRHLDHVFSESLVLDLIALVGFVVVNNPQMQETICDGWSVIKTLCTLPANWLVSRTHSHALLPTLVALADRPTAADAIAAELSMEMLEEYLESPEAQKVILVQVIKQGRTKKNSSRK